MENERGVIALKLKAARNAVGLNQTEMAGVLRVARNTYAVWESPNSQRPPPRHKKLEEIASAYGIETFVFADPEFPIEKVEPLVMAAMHDEKKSHAAVYEALALSRLDTEGPQNVTIMPGTNYLSNSAARLETVPPPPTGNTANPLTRRDAVAHVSGVTAQTEVGPVAAQAEAMRTGSWGPIRVGFQAGAVRSFGSLVNAFFAAARYQLMTLDDTSGGLDTYFDRRIQWQTAAQKNTGHFNGVPTDFYLPPRSLPKNDGVLIEFMAGRLNHMGEPQYSNESALDARFGHILKLEKMSGQKIGRKVLMIYDTGELVRKRPEYSAYPPSATQGPGGGWGMADRIDELRDVAEICGIEVVGVTTPEEAAKLIYQACTSSEPLAN